MADLFYTDSASGKAIIFLHGFCESHAIWDDFITRFQDFRVIVPDLPGFGKSTLIENRFSIEDVAMQVIRLADRLGVEDVVIVGHSLGGYVALAIAEKMPAWLKGFSLFHSTAFADTDEKKANRNKTIDFVKRSGVQPFIDTFVPSLFRDKQTAAAQKTFAIARATRADALIAYTEAMRDRPDRSASLNKYDFPVQIIAGRADAIIPIKTLEEQVTFLRKPAFNVLERSAHMGFFEEPDAAAVAVKTYVNCCFG